MSAKSRKLKIGITAFIAITGIALIGWSSLSTASYYERVDKVVADPATWMAHKSIKVHGYVVPGTIKTEVRKAEATTYRTFTLENNGQRLDVRHRGTVPDTFKDQAETVVTGALIEENGKLLLIAVDGESGISAKCPSKYEAPR